MDSRKQAVFFVLAALLVCLVANIAGGIYGRRIGRQKGYAEGFEAGYNTPHPADTVVRVDTFVVDRPVPVSVKPFGVEMLPVGTLAQMRARIDSLSSIKPDTAFVEMPVPIEVKTYGGKDGDEYEAQVSGWNPSLDWIAVYPRTITITQTIPAPPRPCVGFAVTAGPGAVWNGKAVTGGLGIVAGLSVRFGK